MKVVGRYMTMPDTEEKARKRDTLPCWPQVSGFQQAMNMGEPRRVSFTLGSKTFSGFIGNLKHLDFPFGVSGWNGGRGRSGVARRPPPTDTQEHIDTDDLVTIRRRREIAHTHLSGRNVDQPILVLRVEVMVGVDLRVEPGG